MGVSSGDLPAGLDVPFDETLAELRRRHRLIDRRGAHVALPRVEIVHCAEELPNLARREPAALVLPVHLHVVEPLEAQMNRLSHVTLSRCRVGPHSQLLAVAHR